MIGGWIRRVSIMCGRGFTLSLMLSVAPMPTAAVHAQTGQADTGPGAGDADNNPADNPVTSQIGQSTELASAQRLRDELDGLLTAEGLPTHTPESSSITRLAGLATRCEVLANSATYNESRLILLRCQTRVFNALARQAEIDGDKLALLRRLRQLRLSAQQMKTLGTPEAQAGSAYWLLLADLFDVGRADAPPATQQRQAEQLLNDYLEANAGLDAAADGVTDARLSLAALLDDRGDQAGVAEQLDLIGQLAEADPRRAAVQQLRASAARLGKTLELEGVTPGVRLWRLSEHRGKPVLLHLYADPVPGSVAMIDGIRLRIADRALGGFTVVSLRIGEPRPGTRTAPWPTLAIAAEPGGVLEQLGVVALPTLAWIDAHGRVASIGHTLEVLDQLPPLPAPPADEAPDGHGSDNLPGIEPADGPAQPVDPAPDRGQPVPPEDAEAPPDTP